MHNLTRAPQINYYQNTSDRFPINASRQKNSINYSLKKGHIALFLLGLGVFIVGGLMSRSSSSPKSADVPDLPDNLENDFVVAVEDLNSSDLKAWEYFQKFVRDK